METSPAPRSHPNEQAQGTESTAPPVTGDSEPPAPPAVTLEYADNYITVSVTGEPNSTFEIEVTAPDGSTDHFEGRLNGPTSSLSIANPPQGMWTATATLTDRNENTSLPGSSPTAEAPRPSNLTTTGEGESPSPPVGLLGAVAIAGVAAIAYRVRQRRNQARKTTDPLHD